jgi:hypothetical protein
MGGSPGFLGGSRGVPAGDNRVEILEESLDVMAELGLDEVLGHLGDTVECQVEVETAAAVAVGSSR